MAAGVSRDNSFQGRGSVISATVPDAVRPVSVARPGGVAVLSRKQACKAKAKGESCSFKASCFTAMLPDVSAALLAHWRPTPTPLPDPVPLGHMHWPMCHLSPSQSGPPSTGPFAAHSAVSHTRTAFTIVSPSKKRCPFTCSMRFFAYFAYISRGHGARRVSE